MSNNLDFCKFGITVMVKKEHPDAQIPKYSHDWDAGMDLVAVSKEKTDKYIEYDTGLIFEIPEGYAGFLFPRSSCTKKDLILGNCIGVLDSHFRGTVRLRFKQSAPFSQPSYTSSYVPCDCVSNLTTDTRAPYTTDSRPVCCGSVHIANPEAIVKINVSDEYEVGDRIGQIVIMPVPRIKIVEVVEVSKTKRGEGGFGSTGS